jgi:hypothetical protein
MNDTNESLRSMWLMERVNELEKRIKELEHKGSQNSALMEENDHLKLIIQAREAEIRARAFQWKSVKRIILEELIQELQDRVLGLPSSSPETRTKDKEV